MSDEQYTRKLEEVISRYRQVIRNMYSADEGDENEANANRMIDWIEERKPDDRAR